MHRHEQNGHSTQAHPWLTGGMIVSMCLWGLSWPSSKVLTHYCSPLNITAYRYILVVISLAPALMFMKGGFKLKASGIPYVVISGVLLAAYSYFTFRGLKAGTAGAGGVLVTILNPVFAYSIGIALSRRVPSVNERIGLGLGLCAGLILLKVWENYQLMMEAGNLYFLLAAFIWAAMSKFTATGARYGTSMAFSFWQYLVTLICVLFLTDYKEFEGLLRVREPILWLNLFFSSVIVTTIATTVYFFTTTKLGAERASSFLFLVPFAAAVSAWALLGERVMVHTIAGGFAGILAVYFIHKKNKAQHSRGQVETEEILPPEN